MQPRVLLSGTRVTWNLPVLKIHEAQVGRPSLRTLRNVISEQTTVEPPDRGIYTIFYIEAINFVILSFRGSLLLDCPLRLYNSIALPLLRGWLGLQLRNMRLVGRRTAIG